MDNQCLILLSKFAVMARKSVGAVNSAKLLRDKPYATEIFKKIDAHGDEDLILLSLDLQNMLGMLNSNAVENTDLLVTSEKYVFGPRG